MKKTTLATLAGLLGYSIFGFSFLFSKIALELTTPFVLLSVRFLTAFLVMNLLVLTGRMRLSLRGKPVRMLLLLGLVQPVVYFICENYGIALTSTSFSGIMLGIIPIAGLVLGRLLLKEPCSALQVACALLSIVGVALTSVGGEVRFSLLGTVLLAGAAGSAALFNVISRGTAAYFTAFERTYVMFALGVHSPGSGGEPAGPDGAAGAAVGALVLGRCAVFVGGVLRVRLFAHQFFRELHQCGKSLPLFQLYNGHFRAGGHFYHEGQLLAHSAGRYRHHYAQCLRRLFPAGGGRNAIPIRGIS